MRMHEKRQRQPVRYGGYGSEISEAANDYIDFVSSESYYEIVSLDMRHHSKHNHSACFSTNKQEKNVKS